MIYRPPRITSGQLSQLNEKWDHIDILAKGRSRKTTLQKLNGSKSLQYQFDRSIRHQWFFVVNLGKTFSAEQGIVGGSGMAYNLSIQTFFYSIITCNICEQRTDFLQKNTSPSYDNMCWLWWPTTVTSKPNAHSKFKLDKKADS